jgi:hypothetical protein
VSRPADSFRCRSCGSERTELVLDLGPVPASDHFPQVSDPGPDPVYPLELFRCETCTLLQLGPGAEPPPESPIGVDSATALEHARTTVRSLLDEEAIGPGATVIELDSGHGNSWLPALREAGLVERGPGERADLVVDLHHLMHEQELDPLLAAHRARLAPGGALVCEFFHGAAMIERRLVDTIRHGHYLYLTLTAALPAFERAGLTVTRAGEVDVYGGSLRVAARASSAAPRVHDSVAAVLAAEQACGAGDHETAMVFAGEARQVAVDFRARLEALAAEGRAVAGYGAPSKAPVLLALAGIDRRLLAFTVDMAPAKDGRRIPGTGVPIRAVHALEEERPDVLVILTWDIATEVVDQLRRTLTATGWDPLVHVPLPRPREFRLRR